MKQLFFAFLFITTVVQAQKKQISLGDLYKKNTFKSDYVAGFNSMKDGRFYTELENGNIVRKNFSTGKTMDTLIHQKDVVDPLLSDDQKQLPLTDIQFSNDEQKILVFINREYIYRRSSKAATYVFNLKTKKTVAIDNGTPIMHASFSPDNSKVSFVKDNNLFYQNVANGNITQVTTDGKWNNIINGNCDWVYEEEFEFTKAFEWSPNGKYLAYYRFDESKVPMYDMTMYEDLYPKNYQYKYPKVGEPNSIIQIHVVDIATNKNTTVDIGQETDIYIPRIKWTTNDNQLAVYWMNRLQNHLKILLANSISGSTTLLYEETHPCYIDINSDLTFLQDGKHFLLTSEKDGYNHIYVYNMDGKIKAQISKGKFDVESVIGINEKAKQIYYTAAVASPMDRQLYVTDFTGTRTRQISKGQGWHSVEMNADYTYYMDSYSTINDPAIFSIYNIKGEEVRKLKDNAALRSRMNEYDLGKITFIKVPNEKGDTLNGWMLQPSSFDHTKKYPVLFCNYGGPGSQEVANRFGAVNFWQQMLAEKGYIIVSIDNTGTGFRGQDFKKKTYKQLGALEIEDQIAAAKYMGALPYVDKNRIGHWGWSFGGFMSSLAITKGADVFSMAIAVAPVTNWKYYDNIYTERYMGLLKDNAEGYKKTSPINYADKIKGKFLIIHGTGDDNVHFQNSVEMVKAMVDKNIPFESAYYPNKNHGIYGGNTRYHLYQKMTDFILKNL